MNISILVPHWKTGKMTSFTIAQLLKHKGNHSIDIIVIDNNAGDGSIEYLKPFDKDIIVLNYPKDKLQSHGIAFDFALGLNTVHNEYFITLESDSYPTKNNWLDYYEKLVNEGYDAAGSLLKLSGGTYLHPAGSLYKKSVWQECKEYCDNIPYAYFPNMSGSNGFDCHLMVHNDIFDEFEKNPDDYIELADGYKPYTTLHAIERLEYYKPVVGPFHNGMGTKNENVKTYGLRTMESETPHTLITPKTMKLINRIGLEPGQYFAYWMSAMGKKINFIPTETEWMPGKIDQQQAYTLNEAGIKHIWAISAYHDNNLNDDHIAMVKRYIPELLYESLPKEQKI